MKRVLLLSAALLCWFLSSAKSIEVGSFKYAGPFKVGAPYEIDSLNVLFKSFNIESLLETAISLDLVEQGTPFSGKLLPGSDSYALHLLGFNVENTRYAKATVKIEGIKNYVLFIDGKKSGKGEVSLEPSTHSFVIKYLSKPGENDSIKVSIEDEKGLVSIKEGGKRIYTLNDVMHGTRFGGVELSPNGKYLITRYRTAQVGGKSASTTKVSETATGKVLAETASTFHWMPNSNLYYFTRAGVKGTELVCADPSTGAEKVLAEQLPEGQFQFSPTEDYLLFTLVQKGPKEREEIYQVLEPDDRQPGWRNRSCLAKYDLKTGLMQPLTFGYHNVWAADISSDGRYILMMKSESRLTERPTTLFSIYILDTNTLEAQLLIDKDGYLNGASFSPDGKQLIVEGSPEAFAGIGKNVKEGQTPSMTDVQLFLFNIEDKKVMPLTKDFNPCIQRASWSREDGQVYFTAENLDYCSLYRINTSTKKIEQLEVPEDLVSSFTLADKAPVMVYYGQGASNSDRLYSLNTKNLKSTLKEDLSKTILEGVELGECKEWNFTNSKGDVIYGRYYLPPHFDSSKKYPMIVNFYGGCSPTSRNFETRYPQHAYAALGYIVYVLNPSGATGFGQEFSARHVNTAGEGVAEDIIEGTKQFCKEHSFVDDKKIGCIGASYGGFMTQFLMTKTDIFAAAISHAGISDHTSYWGEGYWGYSYSEVSMANSYPWSDQDLYVKQSPLYNADKIHTPLLFLHGDSDVNVPVGESIQMFTALKLLGRETAFVEVAGQDHHILDYNKRILWQNTIFAWFAKWLQDDSDWWEAIYAPKML